MITERKLSEARAIVTSFLDEFRKEENRLKILLNTDSARLQEIDESISTYRRNEDIDSKIFSPRNSNKPSASSEKVDILVVEKDKIDSERRLATKQLDYYTERVVFLEKLHALLEDDLPSVQNEDTSAEKKPDIFDLVRSLEEEKESVSIIDSANETQKVVSDTSDCDDSVEEDISSSDSKKDSVSSEEEITSNLSELSVAEKPEPIKKEKAVPVSELRKLIHKVEFSEKIMSNDVIRSKTELHNVLIKLRELLDKYSH